MTYRDALRECFRAMLTNWRLVPGLWGSLMVAAGAGLGSLAGLLFAVLSPFLAPLAPLFALLVLADERKRQRQLEEARRRLNERFNRHQRVDRNVG